MSAFIMSLIQAGRVALFQSHLITTVVSNLGDISMQLSRLFIQWFLKYLFWRLYDDSLECFHTAASGLRVNPFIVRIIHEEGDLNVTHLERNVLSKQVSVQRFENLAVKVTNELNAAKLDMKHCHLDILNVNFPLVCRGARKAAEVVAGSYFWRGYQQPSDIGLSDRTSVALDPPLTHLGRHSSV